SGTSPCPVDRRPRRARPRAAGEVSDRRMNGGAQPMVEPGSPPFPAFDPQRFMGMMSRFFQGPEQAMRVYRVLMGLEGGWRERGVDFMAQLARGVGVDAAPLFETVLRCG